MTQPLRVIDSHTAGEPTRIIISGAPNLGSGPLAERAHRLRTEHDWLRSAVCNEPRGHQAMVGGLLVPPHQLDCVAGVIFFNNVSTLNMCIHGTIGLAVTLAYLGKIAPGHHRIDTPVGVVTATLHRDGAVQVANVPSYRYRRQVAVEVPPFGTVTGDVAWGGNWFFLVNDQGPKVHFAHIAELTDFTRKTRRALAAANITGENGAEIDHVEVFGPPQDPALADSKNFVLCPGDAYDRSPCGTGTSAKLACLHAEGLLAPGQIWRQASILDTIFHGHIATTTTAGPVIPHIRGRAWVTAESTYHFDPADPFQFGIPHP